MTRSSFLKSRKQYRKHYIEKDSPRIYRRKNRQAFPRKNQSLTAETLNLGRSGDPAPDFEIFSEIFEILISEIEPPSHLEQSRKTGSQVHRGRR